MITAPAAYDQLNTSAQGRLRLSYSRRPGTLLGSCLPATYNPGPATQALSRRRAVGHPERVAPLTLLSIRLSPSWRHYSRRQNPIISWKFGPFPAGEGLTSITTKSNISSRKEWFGHFRFA